MATSLAFISAGKLFVWKEGSQPQPVSSQFAHEMEERQEKARRRHGWKGDSDELVGGMPGAAVWGKQGLVHVDPLRVECSAVARGPQPGEVTFALQIGDVGGLFDSNTADGNERRLMHRVRLRVEEMERHPVDGRLVYAEVSTAGTIHLAIKHATDNASREVTEGDALDQAPSWVQGAESTVVYQSAGLARTSAGAVALVGPYAIHELDLGTGAVSTLLEDAEHDLLLPHKLADGSLLFIQRPYEGAGRIHYWRLLLDVLLLPVRLVEMLLAFFNFMSLLSSGKPLSQAGGVRAAQPDLKRMMLWGRALEADRRAKHYKSGEPRLLVPGSWQLVRRAADGSEEVLGESVLGYDVATDGTVIFTDGRAVFRRAPGGKAEKVLDHFPIEKITALD